MLCLGNTKSTKSVPIGAESSRLAPPDQRQHANTPKLHSDYEIHDSSTYPV